MSPLEYQSFPYGLFASKKKRGSRVKGGRIIQLPSLEVFLKRRVRDLEAF